MAVLVLANNQDALNQGLMGYAVRGAAIPNSQLCC